MDSGPDAAANASGALQVPELLHGAEQSLHDDAGYIGVESPHIARNAGRPRARSDPRYWGIKKNTAQLHSLVALENLYRARRWGLLPQG